MLQWKRRQVESKTLQYDKSKKVDQQSILLLRHLMLPHALPADRHSGSARQADRRCESAEMNLPGFLRSAAMDACVFLEDCLEKISNLDEKIKIRVYG